MRKITENAVKAFIAKKPFHRDNTTINIEDGIPHMRLYYTDIAKLENNTLTITHGGYTTNTTKERLNGLLATLAPNYKVVQRALQWYLQNNNTGSLEKFERVIKIKDVK